MISQTRGDGQIRTIVNLPFELGKKNSKIQDKTKNPQAIAEGVQSPVHSTDWESTFDAIDLES